MTDERTGLTRGNREDQEGRMSGETKGFAGVREEGTAAEESVAAGKRIPDSGEAEAQLGEADTWQDKLRTLVRQNKLAVFSALLI